MAMKLIISPRHEIILLQSRTHRGIQRIEGIGLDATLWKSCSPTTFVFVELLLADPDAVGHGSRRIRLQCVAESKRELIPCPAFIAPISAIYLFPQRRYGLATVALLYSSAGIVQIIVTCCAQILRGGWYIIGVPSRRGVHPCRRDVSDNKKATADL